MGKDVTICVCYLNLVFKSSCDSNAEYQKDPIDIRTVYLA